MRKVRIVKGLPKASTGASTAPNYWNATQQPVSMDKFAQKDIEVNKSLQPVDRSVANMEAELGETAILNQGGIPTNFNIKGKKHTQGGTPLNLPPNSFIFSDTKAMRIKDPDILAMFNIGGGSHTPAEISKKYDINKYRKSLADSDIDNIDKKTSEMMIENYNLKLAKLGLIQESKKGFPQGIPAISMPYIEMMSVNPEDMIGPMGQKANPFGDNMAKYGGYMQGGGDNMRAVDTYISPRRQQSSEFLFPGNHEDPRFNQEWEKLKHPSQASGIMDYLGTGLGMAQKLSLAPFVGAYESPSQTSERLGTGSNLAGDFVLDPLMVTGVGELAKVAKVPFAMVKGMQEAALPIATHAQVIAKLLPRYGKKLINQAIQYGAKTAQEIEEFARLLVKEPLVQKNIARFTSRGPVVASHFQEENKTNPTVTPTQIAKPLLTQNTSKVTPSVTVTHDDIRNAHLNQSSKLVTEEDIKKAKADETNKSKVSIDTTYVKHFDMGGQLDMYQNGGVKGIRKDEQGRVETTYNDGTVVITRADGSVESTISGKNKANSSGKKFLPYGNEKIRQYIEENSYPGNKTYTGDVAGYQTPSPKGGYGKQDFGSFKTNNTDILKEFKQQFDHDYKKSSKPNAETEWYQNKYNEQLTKDAQAAGYSPEEIQGFINELGFTPEKSGDPRGLDKKHGDWTDTRVRFKFKPKAQLKPGESAVAKAAIPTTHLGPNKRFDEKADFWLQDKIETAGAVSDFWGIEEYPPWQATPGYVLQEPTYLSSERELAANAEATNMGIQGLTAFNNPQALVAGASALQGQNASNAANIMSSYNNQNINIANQFENERVGIMNNASKDRAGLATQLADKYTIMNQQFDNSKAQARQNMRQSVIDAITNRAYTANLNALTKHPVDPNSGGIQYFKGNPTEFNGETSPNLESSIDTTAEKYINKGMGVNEAYQLAHKIHTGSTA